MNSIAAQALANILLPSSHRSIAGRPQAAPSPPTGRIFRAGSGGGGGSTPPTDPRLLTRHRSSSPGDAATPSAAPGSAASPSGPPAFYSSPPSWFRPQAEGPEAEASGSGSGSGPMRLLPDLVNHLCCHPHHRLLTLRSIPQIPAISTDFTTFTWPAMLKRLKQMLLTGSILEEGMDWGVTLEGSPPPQPGGLPGASSPRPGGLPAARINKSLANWMVLRGQSAGEVSVSEFSEPALYPAWAVDPLMVTRSSVRFNKYSMAAAMLSNDQVAVTPVRRMQERAATMLAARAFVHQYEKFGIGTEDFRACFAHVEDIVEYYALL